MNRYSCPKCLRTFLFPTAEGNCPHCDTAVNKPDISARRIPMRRLVLGLATMLANGFIVAWWLTQVLRYGMQFGLLDALGFLGALNVLLAAWALSLPDVEFGRSFLLSVALHLNLALCVLLLAHYLSTFDPHHNVDDISKAYWIRFMFFAGVATASMTVLDRRLIPASLWLILPVAVASAWFIFVYAWPSRIRSWYGHEVNIGQGLNLMVLSEANPERQWQRGGWALAGTAWTILLLIDLFLLMRESARRTASR